MTFFKRLYSSRTYLNDEPEIQDIIRKFISHIKRLKPNMAAHAAPGSHLDER
jgi:hypothetical protein